MSKAVRGAVAILIVLLVVSVGVAVYTLMQKQTLEQQTQGLQAQIAEFQTKESDLLSKAKKIQQELDGVNDRVSQKDKEKQQIQQSYDELKSKFDAVDGQVAQANKERDDWKGRLETIRKERDSLMEKLKSQPEKIVYKEAAPKAVETANASSDAPAITAPAGDQYWAQVLKEKAALQLDLAKAKADLDESALQVTELKKQHADLELEFKNLTDAKQQVERRLNENQQEYERKLKYNEDLANSLSLEIARARNDQKLSNDRSEKIKQDNGQLQEQIKQLSTTKLALEKTIAHINQDKASMQKKLNETEGVIQGRIDEIWQIKQKLDQKISDLPTKSAGQVDLPPIIVNAEASASPDAKGQGTIISINEANHFAIVDLGEGDGSQVGKQLTVFRGNNSIGTLEVIQVRKDISAADIKQTSTKVKVGDVVRY